MAEKVSLLMLTCNDIDLAIVNLEAMKGIVDEQVIVDSSGAPERAKLKRYAEGNRRLRVYDGVALGFPEPLMPFAVGKCRNSWILLLDSDERASAGFLEMLKGFDPAGDAFYVLRYETADKRLATWQLRLFRRGAVRWRGLLHEHPRVTGKKVNLGRESYFMHLRAGIDRGYGKLWIFVGRSRASMILANLYIQIKLDPSIFWLALKNSIAETRRTKEEAAIARMIASQGTIRYLGLDRDGKVEELAAKYRDGKQGADLLLSLVTEKYRAGKGVA